MISELKLNFRDIPYELAGYPVHYKILNQKLELVEEGSINLKSGTFLVDSMEMLTVSSKKIISGNYVFTIKLPSGKTLSNSFEVKDGEVSDVLVPYESSPQEWLRGQTFLGHSLSKKTQYAALEKHSKEENTDDPLFNPHIEVQVFSPQYSEKSVLLHKWDDRISSYKNPLHLVYLLQKNTLNDTKVAQLKVGNSYAMAYLPPDSLCVDGREEITLDLTWTDLVDSVRDLAISVNMKNRQAQALLAYMRQGDIDSAEKISAPLINQAYFMFQDKMRDAGAACAAAYLLIGTSKWDKMPLDWCQNISTFFPNIADGAIINAHRQIVELPKKLTNESLERIAELLIKATSRGLPMFSTGLRLLNDDLLALLNSLKDMNNSPSTIQKVEVASKRVASYVRYCDFSKSFTTLVFDSKEERKKVFTDS